MDIFLGIYLCIRRPPLSIAVLRRRLISEKSDRVKVTTGKDVADCRDCWYLLDTMLAMKTTSNVQLLNRVAVLGPFGTYSHEVQSRNSTEILQP